MCEVICTNCFWHSFEALLSLCDLPRNRYCKTIFPRYGFNYSKTLVFNDSNTQKMTLSCMILPLNVVNCRRNNAAQVIGAVLANHRYLEKLDVGDVQEFILQVVNQVEIHLRNRWPVNVRFYPERAESKDRLETQLWLLAIEITGWWDKEATFYSPRMCERLYEVVIQINFRQHTPALQRTLLELIRIVYSRHPDLPSFKVEPVLNIAWEYVPQES